MERHARTYARKEVDYTDGSMVFLFAIVADLAAQLVIGFVAEFVSAAKHNDGVLQNTYFQLVASLVLQLAFLAAPVIYYARKKCTPQLLCPVRKPHPSLALALVVPFLLIVGFILPTSYFVELIYKLGYPPTSLELRTAGQVVLAVIATVLVAPVVEELIFRGFLLSGLRKTFSPYVAALLSAVAFSLMHMSPEQTVYQFVLGYACALIVLQSGNLLASMLVHAVSNGITLVLDTRVGDYFDKFLHVLTKTPALAVLSTVLLALACGAAVWFLCRAVGKLSKRGQTCEDAQNNGQETSDADAQIQDGKIQENAAQEGVFGAEYETSARGARRTEEENAENRANGGAAQPSAGVKTGKTGHMIFVAGIVLCAVLWVFVLVSGLI